MESCFLRKEHMARMLKVALPLVVFCVLLFFSSRRLRGISSLTDLSIPSRLDAQYAAGRIQSIDADQISEDSHGEGPSHGDGRDKASSGTPTHKTASADKEAPSCVTTGGVAKSFLVIFMGHSGSSAIISELRAHSRVLIKQAEPIDHHEYKFNTSLALKYTRELFSRGVREGKVAGFKMRPWHIGQQPQAWAALAKEFDTRIIWQHRGNVLKQAVGEYSKKYFKDMSSVEGLRSEEEIKNRCKTGAGCRFTISDFEFFHRTLKDCLHSDLVIARGVNVILNGSTCVHDLPYEDYLYNREETMRSAQGFLGLDYEETAPKRFKATRDSLCEVVENWDEVCEKFYGCHVWRHMFVDSRNGCDCHFSSGSTKYCGTGFQN